ncbi:MAG: TIGR01212 family radical SAM protein [Clostridia bacterium]|nr:TIGR01212 family radical SAM protein [Clostridia bacterium]
MFGGKVYRIALSTPFTCPNRDGSKGTGGCAFCREGSGAFAARGDLDAQLQAAKARVAAKFPKGEKRRYVAYFQTGTGTYGPLEVQRALFSRALNDPEVVGLSVATRPDALSDGSVALLRDLSAAKPVWVELGLQTVRDEVRDRMNCRYTAADFEDAARRLRAASLPVVAHLILGLPGADHESEIESVRFIARCGAAGVKFHLLHVLRGTALADMPYSPLTMEEYVYRVTDLLRYLPKDTVVHRLTGDGARKDLIAPLWSADKKRVLNAVSRRIREEGIEQGELA